MYACVKFGKNSETGQAMIRSVFEAPTVDDCLSWHFTHPSDNAMPRAVVAVATGKIQCYMQADAVWRDDLAERKVNDFAMKISALALPKLIKRV